MLDWIILACVYLLGVAGGLILALWFDYLACGRRISREPFCKDNTFSDAEPSRGKEETK